MYVRPEVVDRHYSWSPGVARRLARRGLVPHYRLPDGSIRFCLDEVAAVVVRVAATEPQHHESEVRHDA
jgi:hypothetical protein